MKRRGRVRGLVVIAAALGVISGVGCSGGGGGTPEVAAEVEGAEIPSKDIEEIFKTYLATPDGQAFKEDPEYDEDKITRFILTFQIKTSYLEQLAKQMGVAKAADEKEKLLSELAQGASDEEFAQSGFRRQDFIRSHRAAALSKAIAEKVFGDEVPVSETALREEYDRRAKAFQGSWKMTIETGIFNNANVAQEVKRRVAEGEAFEPVAKELGAVETGTLRDVTPVYPFPPEVINALGELQIGEVSEPIQIALDGWVLARVEGREDLPNLSFEDVKADLTDSLKDGKRQELFDDWFFKKLQRAKVKVSGHYGRWDSEQGNVV